jgi:hypothetical protein
MLLAAKPQLESVARRPPPRGVSPSIRAKAERLLRDEVDGITAGSRSA